MPNKQAMEIQQQVGESALNDALKWLESSGDVAIFNAMNVTLEQSKLIHKRVVEDYNFSLLFLLFWFLGVAFIFSETPSINEILLCLINRRWRSGNKWPNPP